MRDFDLRALQLKELECLKEIDRLCRKHKIEYFLSWGSAIGAIRHKGFIPWDDDIDVSMKMDDYLRFKEVCAQELDAKYFYQDWESDPYYYSSWAKIRINDTTSVMADMVDYPTHNGICIDIFPLLPYPYEKLDKRDAWLAKLVTFFSSKRLNEYHLGKYFYENDKLKYFGSLNYLGQKGIYKSDKLNYDRYNYRTNVSSNFDEIGLTVGLNVNGTVKDELYPSASAYTLYSRLKDRTPFEKPYNEDGTVSNQFDNPALQLDGPGEIKYRTVYNQLAVNLEWAVPWVKGLKFGFDGNYNIESQDRADWYENATYYDADGNATFEDPSNISMTRSSYQHNRYDFNVRADYKNTFNEKHNVLVTLVHNRQYYHGTSLSASSNTFYLSTIHQIQNGDAASITASNKESKQTSMGYVGRLRYDYDNRYMAEFSGRYDGSDCFPKGNRFGFFPSGSLGWAISFRR